MHGKAGAALKMQRQRSTFLRCGGSRQDNIVHSNVRTSAGIATCRSLECGELFEKLRVPGHHLMTRDTHPHSVVFILTRAANFGVHSSCKHHAYDTVCRPFGNSVVRTMHRPPAQKS